MRFASGILIFAFMLCGFLSEAAKKDCVKKCDDSYNPICGKPAEGKGTDITFGNNCVLENYNCEKQDKPYKKFSDGECEGKAPVRLR